MFFTFSFIFFSVKKVFFSKKIFNIKLFFPYKNIFSANVYFVKNIFFQKKFFFQLSFATNEQPYETVDLKGVRILFIISRVTMLIPNFQNQPLLLFHEALLYLLTFLSEFQLLVIHPHFSL